MLLSLKNCSQERPLLRTDRISTAFIVCYDSCAPGGPVFKVLLLFGGVFDVTGVSVQGVGGCSDGLGWMGAFDGIYIAGQVSVLPVLLRRRRVAGWILGMGAHKF